MSRIDKFLFSVGWKDHFWGVHQVVLPKASDHVSILLHVDDVPIGRRTFKFENVWLLVEGFSGLVKAWWDELLVGSPSFITEFFEIKIERVEQRCFWAFGE